MRLQLLYRAGSWPGVGEAIAICYRYTGSHESWTHLCGLTLNLHVSYAFEHCEADKEC